MAWSPAYAGTGELCSAILIGLVIGAIFKRFSGERFQQFRLMVLTYWGLLSACFVLYAVYVYRLGWYGAAMHL